MVANATTVLRLRQSQKLSQAELAERAQCTARTINRIEAGEPTNRQTLERIARALGVAVDELLILPAAESPAEQRGPPAAPSGHVFVSHSSRDREFVEREIIGYLRELGIPTWYSRDDIQPAEEFEASLVRGLEECDRFLLVMSPHAAESDWVKAEVHWAIRNRWPGRIVPVVIDDCEPEKFHLWISRLQHIDFRGNSEKGRRDLAAIFAKAQPPLKAGDRPINPGRPGTIAQPTAVLVPDGVRLSSAVRLPVFHCGGVVPPDFFIDRDNELEDAEDMIRAGLKSFLIVGVRRSGKTSFCNKLQERLLAQPDNDLLASRLNLESCRDLTIETFLGHTILNMVGEIARQVFHLKPADLNRPDPAQLRPDLKTDAAFDTFVNINRAVTEHTHYRAGSAPSPFLPQEFVQCVTDLLDIIRAKGWRNYVLFYDEANHLPARLSVEMLTGNIEILNSAKLTTVYAASPEMVDSFQPLHDLFGQQIRIGPFESQKDLVRLLARYYNGDISRTNDLPISADALQMIWDYALGMPFRLQFLLSYSFQHARVARTAIVTEQHVTEAHRLLSQERPDHFGRAPPH